MVTGEAQKTLIGLQILAVPQLSAVLEYQAASLFGNSLNDFSDFGVNTITETLSYDLSPVKVGVTAYEWIPMSSDIDLGFKVNPWVSYTYGAFTPKLGVTYDSNDFGWDETKYAPADVRKADKNYTINVKPQVTFAAGPNASIVGAYSFTSYGDVAKVGNSGETSKHVFYVDFLWKF